MPAQERRPIDELICEVGDQIEIAGVFQDDEGTASDPERVFVAITLPTGQVISSEYGAPNSGISKLSVGAYIRQFVPTSDGRHYWRLWGEGGVTRAHVGTVIVMADPTRTERVGDADSGLIAVTLSAQGSVTP